MLRPDTAPIIILQIVCLTYMSQNVYTGQTDTPRIVILIPCVQTTKNKHVDPVIDIKVITDGTKCEKVDYNKTAGEEDYFVNTNLNYGRDEYDGDGIFICYIKGDKETDNDDRIVWIGFFTSSNEIHDDLIEITGDSSVTNDCDEWHIITEDINQGIGDKYMYLGYQKADDCTTTDTQLRRLPRQYSTDHEKNCRERIYNDS